MACSRVPRACGHPTCLPSRRGFHCQQPAMPYAVAACSSASQKSSLQHGAGEQTVRHACSACSHAIETKRFEKRGLPAQAGRRKAWELPRKCGSISATDFSRPTKPPSAAQAGTPARLRSWAPRPNPPPTCAACLPHPPPPRRHPPALLPPPRPQRPGPLPRWPGQPGCRAAARL